MSSIDDNPCSHNVCGVEHLCDSEFLMNNCKFLENWVMGIKLEGYNRDYYLKNKERILSQNKKYIAKKKGKEPA